MKKVLVITILLIVLAGCTTIDKNGEAISSLSDDKLFILWDETRLGTDINSKAYSELNKRGYWDNERNKDEREAHELLEELSGLSLDSVNY